MECKKTDRDGSKKTKKKYKTKISVLKGRGKIYIEGE